MSVDDPVQYLIPPELRELVASINDTARDVPLAPLDALVLARLEARPAAVVLATPDVTLTGGQVARAADEVAATVAAAGAGPGDVVGICLEFGWQQVVAMLGALRAGAAFRAVPAEAGQLARNQALAEAGGTVVLTQPWLEERMEWAPGTVRVLLDLDDDGEPAVVGTAGHAGGPASARSGSAAWTPPGTRDVDATACVVEGEHGELASLTHASIVNTFDDVRGCFAIGEGDRLLALSPVTSPRALFDALGMLSAGGGVVLPRDIDLRRPHAWLEALEAHGATIWHATPALTAMLTDHLLRSGAPLPDALRLVLLSGELVGLPLARTLRELAADRVTTANLAGRPACGIWSLCMPFDGVAEDWKHVPAGKPMANQRVYVLSDELSPCPVWVSGRVYVGGAGLAGEVRAEGGEPFVTHPDTGERLYRTPDQGRLLEDGTVELLGDDTGQVMVHGHALNARDAEVALARHEGVAQAVVVPAGDGELAAWVCPSPGHELTPEALGEFLRRKLSPYLLPSVIEVVEELPLTSDGRVHRAALAATATGGAARQGAAATPAPVPASGASERIHALAVEVLGIARMEPDMNLLDLGATSVDLVRLATRVEQDLGVPIDVAELLRFPSLAVVESLYAAGVPASAAAEQAGGDAPAATLILDPAERQAFKDADPAIREGLDATAGVQLQEPPQLASATARRTHRRFSPGPVPLRAFGALVGALRAVASERGRKYWYPSAGGLYPVQTYLSVKDGRVEGVPGGTYYYHPVRNRLAPIRPGRAVPDDAHAWINRDAAGQAAFTILLVLDADAIMPLYGERARDYGLVEAGAMAQLLMMVAAEEGLGLCAIGEMREDPLAELLDLGSGHGLLHALLGGVPDPDGAAAAGDEARLLARLDDALPADVGGEGTR